MIVKLLAEHRLEFLSLKGGRRGSSMSTLDKMPHCWKSHVTAHISVTSQDTNRFNTCHFILNIFLCISNGPRREKTCLRGFANNKGADQPAQMRSLVSAFVVRLTESIMSRNSTNERMPCTPIYLIQRTLLLSF